MTNCLDTSGNYSPYRAVRISDHVYWVGAIDWGLRDFHGYTTERGTTYNAYLILADTVTLIDTVRAPFVPEMLERVASVIDPGCIDTLVSLHSEMDHSGGLPAVIARTNPARVLASPNGVKALMDHFHLESALTTVKDSEVIDLGNMGLTVLEARMLHWPDSMLAYLDADKVFFTNDAFGMHLASSRRFDDEEEMAVLEHEAKNYYANILTPYSGLVLKLLERVTSLNLPVSLVAPDHGPIWRSHIATVLHWYRTWAEQQPTTKAVVLYDTMWESTAKMARAITEGLSAGGATPRLMPIHGSHRSDIALELIDAGALLVGSPTLNNNLFPPVADVLTYLKGLRKQNLIGAAFGSYGWGGEAVGQVQDILTAMKIDLVADGLKVKYVPDGAALASCYALGQDVAARLLAKVAR